MLSLTVPPAGEPLTWIDAKRHLRLDDDHELELVEGILIPGSRAWLEAFVGRQLITATYALSLCAFPVDGVIRLPMPPLQSVSSVKYLDTAGVEQTLPTSAYVVEAPAGPLARPGRITLAQGQIWPATLAQEKAVTVTFVAGYGAADAVPKPLVQAMLLMIGQTFEHREQQGSAISSPNVVTAERLAADYRVIGFD